MSMEKVNFVQASLLPGNEEESCHGYINCTLDSNGECVFGGKLSNVSGQYCISEASCYYKEKNYSKLIHMKILQECLPLYRSS